MDYADVTLKGCYDLHCLLWKSSINKAFEHWEGAMAELFWPDYRAAAGSRIGLKNADFRLTGQNASPLAYALSNFSSLRGAKATKQSKKIAALITFARNDNTAITFAGNDNTAITFAGNGSRYWLRRDVL